MPIQRLYDISPLRPLIEQGFTILTPNLRLARRIKAVWDQEQAEAGNRAWPSLPVFALEEWLIDCWQRAIGQGELGPSTRISSSQEHTLWQQVIAAEARRGERFDLLRPSAAADLASAAREDLLRWQVDLSAEDTRQTFSFDIDCATFLSWSDAFGERLADKGLSTASDCIRQLIDQNHTARGGPVALVDFDDIPPLHLSAVHTLCPEVEIIEMADNPAPLRGRAFSNRRGELAAIARWAMQTSLDCPEDTVGIVLTDMTGDRAAMEYLLRREFGCLGDNYQALPVNFSTGISLDRTPIVRDALAALSVTRGECSVAQVVKLLHSRYLNLPDRDSDLAQLFVSRLHEAGREYLPPGRLRYLATEIKLGQKRGLALGRILLTVAGRRELKGRAEPSTWVEHFCEVLDTWGWPGTDTLDSLEYQQVELWYRMLEDFRGLDGVCERLDYSEALAQLNSACARQMSQPQTADSRIHVLGPLEAAGLSFDHLWLCGMQAGDWPASPRPNPLIPLQLQRQLHMPHATAEREWQYCAGLMRQYRRGASELTASYSRQLDGIPELPSSLLEGCSWEEGEEPAAVNEAWKTAGRENALECVQDDRAPAVDEDSLAATSGGSALLEDQSQCPFRAFARRRLAVEPLGDFSLALSPAERGSLLHDALFALWGDIVDHATLLSLSEEGESAAIARAIESAMSAMPDGKRRAFGATYWQLENQRLSRLLQAWLKLERGRGDFLVEQREQTVELELARLTIRLRVDRIDQLPDGSRVIIDYKSGNSSVNDWLGDRPARPQLLLYCLSAPQDTAALAFAQVRPRDCRYVGLGTVEGIPGVQTAEDWESLNSHWRATLERLAGDYLSGAAAVDPLSPGSCTWCGLQPLCRIGDSEVAP